MHFSKKTLQNGLTVVEVPSKDVESVVVTIMVKTGSRSESPRENGISHFLEHFLFKGTQKFPTALAINEIVDGIGGEMNAYTSKESTQYFIKAATQHFELIFDILTDMILAPLLDAEELEKEKGVIVEEMNMYKDTPQARVGDILEFAMWPKTPLGAEIIGSKKTIMGFTSKMFNDYLTRYYQPQNIIIGISGKYDQKVLVQKLNQIWKKVPRKKLGGWDKVIEDQKTTRFISEYKQTEQAHISLGYKAYPYGHKLNPALSVLSAVLGGGMSGRLFMEVREKRGLAYYVRCGPGHYQDTGSFTVSAGVQVKKITEAIEVIMAELERVKAESVAPEELLKAKSYLTGRTVLNLEDNQSKLDWFMDQIAFQKTVKTPKQVFELVEKVSAEDVVKAAKEILQKEKLTLAVIGPYKTMAPFKKLFKA